MDETKLAMLAGMLKEVRLDGPLVSIAPTDAKFISDALIELSRLRKRYIKLMLKIGELNRITAEETEAQMEQDRR